MSSINDESLRSLEDILRYRFDNPELLRRALRHGSADSASSRGSYQRMEFLGDAVLGHAIALLLFEEFPSADQGVLTRMRSLLTRSSTLSQKAALFDLDGYVELGLSEESARGRERRSLLEDVFEAVVAAIAIDGGWGPALDFVRDVFLEDIENMDERTLIFADAKTALQEAAQSRGLELPEYREVGQIGPDHDLRWAYTLHWDGEEVARGEGQSKRDAQQQAARRALARLGLAPQKGR